MSQARVRISDFTIARRRVSAGLQVSLGGNWSGGLALGYDDTDTTSGNAKADGERFNAARL